jgi:hypothetical protein
MTTSSIFCFPMNCLRMTEEYPEKIGSKIHGAFTPRAE